MVQIPLGWSPIAAGVLNLTLHPVVILLTLDVLCLLLAVALHTRFGGWLNKLHCWKNPLMYTDFFKMFSLYNRVCGKQRNKHCALAHTNDS